MAMLSKACGSRMLRLCRTLCGVFTRNLPLLVMCNWFSDRLLCEHRANTHLSSIVIGENAARKILAQRALLGVQEAATVASARL